MREALLYYAVTYRGEYHAIKKAIQQKEDYIKIDYDGHYLTILDTVYPPCLLQLQYPPFVLFYEGDISLLQEEMVAVVGARIPSTYAIDCNTYLMKHLQMRYGVVSGLAKGIDSCAHIKAFAQGRKTIGIIGCGLDVIYPKENQRWYEMMKTKGLLLSEYPYGVKPLAHHFPWRNRLIAALGKALVVIEGKIKSGTMITVNEALLLGKDIYCFPHDVFREQGEGCNALLEQGCQILYNIESIKEI